MLKRWPRERKTYIHTYTCTCTMFSTWHTCMHTCIRSVHGLFMSGRRRKNMHCTCFTRMRLLSSRLAALYVYCTTNVSFYNHLQEEEIQEALRMQDEIVARKLAENERKRSATCTCTTDTKLHLVSCTCRCST